MGVSSKDLALSRVNSSMTVIGEQGRERGEH